MKKYLLNIIHFIAIGALFSLITCKHSSEPGIIALKEYPKILSVTIPGISEENIAIDQDQHLITVSLPDSLIALEMVPTFKVSEQVTIQGNWAKGKKMIRMPAYCACNVNQPNQQSREFIVAEDVRLDNLVTTSYYKIKLKINEAPLRIKPLSTPLVYDSKSTQYSLYIPVENYYGSSPVISIAVTKTGVSTPNRIGFTCLDTCEGMLNELSISLYGYLIGPSEPPVTSLKPGMHDLDLWFFDGSHVHIEGAVLVK